MFTVPRVKVCCIGTLAEAETAVAAGAHALGLVSEMPSGPGVIDEAEIAAIAAAVSPPVETFLLTARTRADTIAEQHALCRTTTIQLVDRLPRDEARRLHRWLPGVRLVQVVHVTGEGALEEALAAASWADALLLDSGNPGADIPELGGTGRVHDWTLSRRIRDAVSVPLYLAGGLRPGNVAEAIRIVRPWGLDLCSGVRTPSGLSPDLLNCFFSAVRGTCGP